MAGELRLLPRTPWNPLAFSDTPMEPSVLLAAKLAFVALAGGGFFLHVGQPFAPLLGPLDALRAAPGFGALLQAAFWIPGVALLLNRHVRVASAACGVVVLWTQLQSRPALASPALLLGFLLVLAGLEAPRRRPLLLRWQIVVVFVIAFAGKIADPLWRDGTVMAGLIESGMAGPFFAWSAGVRPPALSAAGFSWAIMVAQFALACGLATTPWNAHAVRYAVIVQLATLLLLPTAAMAAWSIAVGIGLLAFLDWPQGPVRALWPRSCGWPLWLRIALDRYDWDHRIVWPLPPDPEADLEVDYDDVEAHHWHAARALVLHFPAFWVATFLVLFAVHRLLPPSVAAIVIAVFGLTLWTFLTVPASMRWIHRPH